MKYFFSIGIPPRLHAKGCESIFPSTHPTKNSYIGSVLSIKSFSTAHWSNKVCISGLKEFQDTIMWLKITTNHLNGHTIVTSKIKINEDAMQNPLFLCKLFNELYLFPYVEFYQALTRVPRQSFLSDLHVRYLKITYKYHYHKNHTNKKASTIEIPFWGILCYVLLLYRFKDVCTNCAGHL